MGFESLAEFEILWNIFRNIVGGSLLKQLQVHFRPDRLVTSNCGVNEDNKVMRQE